MCIVFTCGEHTFRKEVEGYEGIVCRCYNCGNYAGHVIKSHPWFTFCFIPVVPLSIKGYEDVSCHICNFSQPLEHRPDVQALKNGGNGMPLQHQQPHHGGPPPGGPSPPPAGWGGNHGAPGYGAPGYGGYDGQQKGPDPNQPMQYR